MMHVNLFLRFRRRNGVLETPGKKHNRASPMTELDSFEESALRREIMDSYIRKEIPTAAKLRVFLVESFEYSGSIRSVRRMLRRMGFRWRRQNNRRLLLERKDIITWRRKFLRELRKNASSENPLEVVYLDETYLHKTETVSKLWQLKDPKPSEEAACCIKVPIGKGPRLIIVHAGGKNGWIEGAHLMWRSNSPQTADYHGDMNAQKFEDWFVKLCLLLKERSLLVMDNASYHSVVSEKTPTSSWTKGNIQVWLKTNSIEYPTEALKVELLAIAKSHHKDKVYKLDQIAESHGHRVLRLPPYHCDLNPIELVWGQCKRYVRENNKDFTLASLELLWREAVARVSPQRWSNCVEHVEKLEKEYWEKDGLVENVIDQLVINYGDSSSDTASDSSDENDEDLGVAMLPNSPE